MEPVKVALLGCGVVGTEVVRILREHGYPDDVCDAILGHASYTGVPRTTPMARTLFAVDELTGLVTATALVKPSRSLAEVDAKSVRKRTVQPPRTHDAHHGDDRDDEEPMALPD